MPEGFSQEKFKELPEDHWFEVMRRISEKFKGEKPSPMEVRAAVLLELAGIPGGQYSALQTEDTENGDAVRVDPEGDRAIAEYLTNPAGLTLSGTKGITTSDLRDRYPDGLPEEILTRLDEKTQRIIETVYDYDRYSRNGEDPAHPLYFHFLPGGTPVVLVGYDHTRQWQEEYGYYMKEIGKEASIVSIEGHILKPFGGTLSTDWTADRHERHGYADLMKDLVSSGYHGLFTEVDGRDISRVDLERVESFFRVYFLDLPELFYERYLAYLKREDTKFGVQVGTKKKLKKMHTDQSNDTNIGLWRKDREAIATVVQNGKKYHSHPALTDAGEVSLALTGNELGQTIYTDALAAIKLHLLGKMMNDGYVPKGAIVDYEGAYHLSSKSFFLQYPEYAMKIILRTIPELLAGQAERRTLNNLSVEHHAENVFEHTDWEQVIREIFRIPFKKIADPKPGRDGVEPGVSQRPMVEVQPDSYVLDTILSSRRKGERTTADWVKIMNESIKKLAF